MDRFAATSDAFKKVSTPNIRSIMPWKLMGKNDNLSKNPIFSFAKQYRDRFRAVNKFTQLRIRYRSQGKFVFRSENWIGCQ